MINLYNVIGSQSLFTTDGGPGQQRWYNIRLFATRVSSTPSIEILINNASVPVTPLTVTVSSGTPTNETSTDLLLTTGDVVTAYVSGGAADIVVSANVDTEEV